jgi:hypothetical protein
VYLCPSAIAVAVSFQQMNSSPAGGTVFVSNCRSVTVVSCGVGRCPVADYVHLQVNPVDSKSRIVTERPFNLGIFAQIPLAFLPTYQEVDCRV